MTPVTIGQIVRVDNTHQVTIPYIRKQTCAAHKPMSAKCHKQTFRP